MRNVTSPVQAIAQPPTRVREGVSPLVRRLIALTLGLTYLLIVLGAIVRVLDTPACPDWPLCYGRLLPPPDIKLWVKWLHWLDASVVGIILVITTGLAWAELTISHPVTRMLALTIPILLIEAGVGGLAAFTDLPARVVAIHLALSLILFAQVEMAWAYARRPRVRFARATSARWIDTTLVLLYFFLLSGALITQTGVARACPDWPLCQDAWWPGDNWAILLNVAHRYFAVVVGLILGYTVYRVHRDKEVNPPVRRWLILAALFFLADALVGALNVWTAFQGWTSAVHMVLGATVWAFLVWASAIAYVPGAVKAPRERRHREAKGGWRAYVGLMKPGIVALLVVTTLAGMIIAARGWPDTRLLLWTMIGSILSAGGANALNSYYDRDIDGLMARTSRRPLPQGLVTPRQALIFGVACIVAGVFIMTVWVNPLAGAITALGAFWYTVIYTRWLKRSTDQNIVIGGAAGAFAPMVGWAAVTGRVDILAVVLFLLIFMWTPPHTWAFALVVLKDYQRVGIPMLPVVRGIERTTREIVLYTWLTVAVTFIPSVLGILGPAYLAGMVILNAIFLYLAYRLQRQPDKALANRLYQYSNAYLYLTFALMAFDRMGGLL